MKTKIAVFGLMITSIAALCFSGCHTVEGMGKDVEAAGEGLQHAAE